MAFRVVMKGDASVQQRGCCCADAWGDMVLVLTDGSRLELRSMPRFRDIETYIEERIKASPAAKKSDSDAASTKGFAA